MIKYQNIKNFWKNIFNTQMKKNTLDTAYRKGPAIISDRENMKKKKTSTKLRWSGCGCVLIILGALGVDAFGAPAGALILIGILVMLFEDSK